MTSMLMRSSKLYAIRRGRLGRSRQDTGLRGQTIGMFSLRASLISSALTAPVREARIPLPKLEPFKQEPERV